MIKFIEYTENYQIEIHQFLTELISSSLSSKPCFHSDLENIISYIDNGGNFWIALCEETDSVVGTLALEKVSDSVGILRRFYVREQYRGHQIGYHLFTMFEEYLKQTSIKTIYLYSHESLKKSHSIYERNGFIRIPKKEYIEDLPLEDRFYFKKEYCTK